MPRPLNIFCIFCGCLIDIEIAPDYPVCIMCDSDEEECGRCHRPLNADLGGRCEYCDREDYEWETSDAAPAAA